ncbi:MAG: hypothetical protein Q8P64_07970 [Deltaproteobacteria bacterium]|nr:hypothetical protein [Deltaproteobacteria bacterium]
MPLNKESREVLRFGVKALLLQEVRLFRMEQVLTPEIIKGGISRSIEETKREIVRLTRTMSHKERASLLKKMIRKAVDEEIDRAIQLRKNRCFRCIHGRFYDRSETAYLSLPLNEKLTKSFGCDQLRPTLRKTCRRFVEISTAHSLEDYLNEMAFLYEFREMVDRMEEIWKDYFTK